MTTNVFSGQEKSAVEAADCIEWFRSMPSDSVDLVFGSPPYEDSRSYGINFKLKGQAWVDWMFGVCKEASRVCKGLVAFVVEGKTKNFRWSAVPVLLQADLHRAGYRLRKPPVYHRDGICGSGGPDWLRNSYETIICISKGKLPWSDNTSCGHPPVYGPGGEISHRTKSGERVNALTDGRRREADADGNFVCNKKKHTKAKYNGDEQQAYKPPKLANPGNVLHYAVGGGRMGSMLAHDNEAPFHIGLAEFFVKSFCPHGGIVCDPFCGSGTTLSAALMHGRRAIGCDIRQSQVDLTLRRIEETNMQFV